MAQESPIQSWNLTGPWVVSAVKSGAVSPSLSDIASPPSSAVEVLRAHQRAHAPVGGPGLAPQAVEVAPVDVDLDGVAPGGIVHRVDLVVRRNEERDRPGAVAGHAPNRQRGATARALGHPIAGLLDLVVD